MDSQGGARRGAEAVELPQAIAGADVPEPEPTGNAAVDAALERLRELGPAPTGSHPDVYEDVHHRLQAVLADLDRAVSR
jgi:hypothetical protein